MTESTLVTTIILAAGTSSRFRGHGKLLQVLGEIPVIESTIQHAAESPVDEIIVVTGFRKSEIEALIANMSSDSIDIRRVFNLDFEKGLSSSIACGVRAAAPGHDFLIWPGDMPLITAKSASSICRHGRADTIALPIFEGRRGHPVFFGRSFREELLLLDGDRGARSVLDRHSSSIVEVEVPDPGVVFDVDTHEDLVTAMKILRERS